jgi:hypothetical protein
MGSVTIRYNSEAGARGNPASADKKTRGLAGAGPEGHGG